MLCSTSASVVAQDETLMRIAMFPCQEVPPHQQVPSRWIAAIQQDGTCWCGGTSWQGHIAMRISVSSWATTDADVEQSIEAILRCAREVRSAAERS